MTALLKHRPPPLPPRPPRTYEPLKTLSAPERFVQRPPLALAGTCVSWIACATCGKQYCPSAVVTGKPEPCAKASFLGESGFMVLRKLYCDHCDHIQVWRQKSAADGALYDLVLEGPGWIRSRNAVNTFLRAHPQAVGVSQ